MYIYTNIYMCLDIITLIYVYKYIHIHMYTYIYTYIDIMIIFPQQMNQPSTRNRDALAPTESCLEKGEVLLKEMEQVATGGHLRVVMLSPIARGLTMLALKR